VEDRPSDTQDVQQSLDGSMSRVLQVAEAVALHGPIALAELCTRLAFSKASIWRCLDVLRARDWVRMRLGDNAFEATAGFAERTAGCHRSIPLANQINAFLRGLIEDGPFHVEFGALVSPGEFVILETSKVASYRRPMRSLVDDDIAIAAQLGLSPSEKVVQLSSYLRQCSEEERRAIQSGDHGKHIRQLKAVGLVWGQERTSFAAPCLVPSLIGAAFRVELKPSAVTSLEAIEAVASRFRGSAAVRIGGSEATAPLM
jgi:hypothetical protein